MARRVSIERAIAAIESIEQLQGAVQEVLQLLKNLAERVVALESRDGKGTQS